MEIGRQLGTYVLERKLGEGGMGVVYAARHVRIGRLYAIKVLLPELAKRKESLARFEREARALSALGHPNIVPIHDFAIEPDGTAFIAMDLLEGTGLSRATASGPLDGARARRIAMDIASGLGAAHQLGLVHRDLKPSNVFLVGRGERERAVLLDFGLAKALDEQAPVSAELKDKLTASGTILGTPHYMSPEQARGETLDARADVWALGVVLYELLTGRLPFEGPTIATIFAAILAVDPVPPSARVAVSGELEALTMACLDKDRERRPKDGDAVLARLEGTTQAPATRVLPSYEAATIAATPVPVTTPPTRATPTPVVLAGPVDRPRRSRSVFALVVLGLGTLLLLALALFVVARTRSTSEVDFRTPSPPTLVAAAASLDAGTPIAVAAAEPDAAVVPPISRAITEVPPATTATRHGRARHDAPPPTTTTGAPPATDDLVGRVPPGMESSPGARELMLAGEHMENGDFAGCLRDLSAAPETQHILSVEMSCANAAHDRPALTRVCGRLRQHFPQSVYNQTCTMLLSQP